MIIKCCYCANEVEKETGHVNRANKLGLNLYCNRTCAGLGKRISKEEKKRLKAEYDRKRRKELADILKQKAREYNSSPAGRAMQKRNREKFKESHKAYIKTDRYRKWKQDYDKQHHAKKKYGEFYEAALVLYDIEKLILPEKHQIRLQKGTYNKSQKRKRLWNSQQTI